MYTENIKHVCKCIFNSILPPHISDRSINTLDLQDLLFSLIRAMWRDLLGSVSKDSTIDLAVLHHWPQMRDSE